MNTDKRSKWRGWIGIMAIGIIVAAPWYAGCKKSGGRVTTNPNVVNLNYEKYRLKNGLDVILLEDHRLPLVAVNIWYHVGPANERPGLTGFAHLFEHMMFEGSRHVGEKAHFRYLEAAGANEINGTTDFDRTNYFETLPSNQLELALWLESDRMGFLLEKLDDRNLENQRDVVRNERRQSVEGAPYGLVQEALFHQLYPKEHPYYASVIGSHADIEAARLGDVREFFQLYYAPNNASLAIVGDIDKAKTKALVEKYFGPIPSGKPVPPIGVQTPPIAAERRAVVGDQVELPKVYLGWITDPIYKPGDAECDLIARILGGGKSSRLYKRLVYEKRIAQNVSAQQYSLALGSVFTIEATAKPGIKPEELEKNIDEEIEAFQKSGPTQVELEGARNAIEAAIIRGLETLGGFGGVADRLNQYNHFLGDPGYLTHDLDRYRRTTAGALQTVAQTRLGKQSRIVVYGVPGQKVIDDVPRSTHVPASQPVASTAAADQEWRKQTPAPGPASHMQLPVPGIFKLSNGLTVYLVEQHNLPIVSANMVVLSGSERNPISRPGLASFTASMLDEGTKKRPALQIARDAEQLGAVLSTGSSMDMSYVAIRTLKKTVDGAFELAADVLLNPQFSNEEMDRLRNDRLTQILQQKDEPNILAGKTFSGVIYGTNSPYGYTEVGTEESNKTMTRDELVNFWRAGYVPENAALVVAGDITEAETRALAEKYFVGWTGKAAPSAPPSVNASTTRRVIIVDKPGSPQTVLRVGHVGVARSSPDYAPIEVMNATLGGLFSSRINLNLRETHGYTYGAFSTFAFRRGAGPFLVGTGVRTDITAEAVTEILRELERIRATDPTPEEVAMAKDSIARSLPGYFETTGQTAATIGQIYVYSLPIDQYRTLPGQIDAVTAADMHRVAEKYLKPPELVIVAVGDRSKIEPGLRKLAFGPVEIRDLNGKPAGPGK
jgi:zinc protease